MKLQKHYHLSFIAINLLLFIAFIAIAVNPRELHQSTDGTPSIVSVDNQNSLSFCSPVSGMLSYHLLYTFCGEYEIKECDGGKTIFLSLSLVMFLHLTGFQCLVFSRTSKSSRDDNYCLYRNSEGEVIIETTLCSTIC